MRGIAISLFIIFFCLASELVLELDDQVFEETNQTRRLLAYRSQNLPLDKDSIPGISPSVSGGNDTAHDLLEPVQQPQSVVGDVMGFFGFLLSSILWVVNVLFVSTLGFYQWGIDELFLPEFLALTFQVLIILAHTLTILQWVSKQDVRSGG